MRPIVGYQVLTTGAVAVNVSGIAYTYMFAAGGVYVRAENTHLRVTIPVAAGTLRGLQPVSQTRQLKAGRIPNRIWQGILVLCNDAASYRRELLCEVVWLPDRGHGLRRPKQLASASALAYERDAHTVLQLHSHHAMPAFFSATDNRDEQGLGLYGVLGRLGVAGQRPEVLLRVGVYGYYQTLPWDFVFAGELGEVRDLARDAPDDAPPDDAPLVQPSGESLPSGEEIDAP